MNSELISDKIDVAGDQAARRLLPIPPRQMHAHLGSAITLARQKGGGP